jgi:predicted metal-dependent peptidase
VTLLACDEAIDPRAPWRFEAWEPLQMPTDLKGGGGTCFVPVFDWISRGHFRPDALVYFTDAVGEFPASAPDYPVVWLVKGGSAAVPWGERIQVD